LAVFWLAENNSAWQFRGTVCLNMALEPYCYYSDTTSTGSSRFLLHACNNWWNHITITVHIYPAALYNQ